MRLCVCGNPIIPSTDPRARPEKKLYCSRKCTLRAGSRRFLDVQNRWRDRQKELMDEYCQPVKEEAEIERIDRAGSLAVIQAIREYLLQKHGVILLPHNGNGNGGAK